MHWMHILTEQECFFKARFSLSNVSTDWIWLVGCGLPTHLHQTFIV